jgi:hypothetical protein
MKAMLARRPEAGPMDKDKRRKDRLQEIAGNCTSRCLILQLSALDTASEAESLIRDQRHRERNARGNGYRPGTGRTANAR